MKQLLLSFIFAFASLAAISQPTWSEEAAAVFYDKCAKCHYPDGVAPFSILEYETAYDYRGLIQSYVEADIMPPWFADSSFQHYFDERILSEFQIILNISTEDTQKKLDKALKRNLEGQRKNVPLETKSSNPEVSSQEENSDTNLSEEI